MKKIVFTLCGFLILSSMAVEINTAERVDINTDSEYSKPSNFFVNFGKTKHRRGMVLDQKTIEERPKSELDVNVKEMINQGVLDYTTQPITPFF